MGEITRCVVVLLLALEGGNLQAGETTPAAESAWDAEIERGEQIFRGRCQLCHTSKAGEGHATGPNLYGVARRGQAMLVDYAYSDALLKGRGERWGRERLDRLLQSPRKFAPGTVMLFSGLPSSEERRAVIRFLVGNVD